MKLSEIWATYDFYTKAASDGVRSLSLAGIAVVWFFKTEQEGVIHLDRSLLYAGVLFVTALTLDLAQYVLGTIVFHVFGSIREKKRGAARDADNPVYVNWPTDICFWLKLLAVMVGYVILLQYLIAKLV